MRRQVKEEGRVSSSSIPLFFLNPQPSTSICYRHALSGLFLRIFAAPRTPFKPIVLPPSKGWGNKVFFMCAFVCVCVRVYVCVV